MPYFVFARFRNAEGQTYGPILDWIIYDPVAPLHWQRRDYTGNRVARRLSMQ
jgi:hypothetical protein